VPTDTTTLAAKPPTPKRRLRWYQFSLRSLLLFVLVVSIGMSCVAVRMQDVKKQQAAVEAIRQLGGQVGYDYEVDGSTGAFIPNPKPPGPAWLRRILGDSFFTNVVAAVLDGDEQLEKIDELRRIRYVFLTGAGVTDAGLIHLKGLDQLQELTILDAKLTDAGLSHLEGLSQLHRLTITNALSFAKFTDAGLMHLERLNLLQELILSDAEVTNEAGKRLRHALPHCRITIR
jgi:hypothetical protein